MIPIPHPPENGFAQVRLLGAIEVTGPSGRAVFTGSRQPALLGLLALCAPALVPRYRLIDGLWGDDPPRTAVRTLHSHIARLRQALEECGLPGTLRTREPGYLLAIDPGAVDASQFEQEVQAARADLDDDVPQYAVKRLRAALGLWRGDAFADAAPTGWAAAEVDRLHEVRLTALEDLWRGELRLGRHVIAAGELDRLRVDHPLREQFAALSMLALYRCGRSADALAVYRRLRRDLVGELGTEPGPELAELHTRILRRDPGLDPVAPAVTPRVAGPPARPRPAELPAGANHFTGRTREITAIDEMADEPGARVIVISGAAGIGKTALAVHWGGTAVPRFPDGQIFLDLRGDDPATALSATDALAQILASLDRPDAALPSGLAERAGLYRSVTRDRRLLIIADNARDTDQILPLVPAGPGMLLVVTARSRLSALATHHATGAVALDALEPDEAIALLGAVLGPQRLLRERAGAALLADLCDRMPLALQIAAAKLAARPQRGIGDLAGELADGNRLDELSVEGGSRSVRAVFATAYQVLTPAAARAFRLMGLHPGTTWTTDLAAAVTGTTVAVARRAMGELTAAHLATETGPGRYRYHDLLRLYARERAAQEDTEADRQEARERLQDWYLAVAEAANRVVDSGRDRIAPELRYRPADAPFAPEPHDALAYLDGERDNLLPVMTDAQEHGRPSLAWQMTYLLTGFFDSRGHWSRRVRLCLCGVSAAVSAGDPAAEALMRSGLGVAYLMTRRTEDALAEFGRALILMRGLGDQRGEAHAYNNIAVAYSSVRRFGEAVGAYQRALALHTAQASALGIALCLNNLGDVYVRMGQPGAAIEHLNRALSASREIGNRRLEAAALSGLGQAYRRQCDWDQANAYFGQALALRRASGDRRYEADTLNNLGLTEVARGADATGHEHFVRALAISREIVDPHQESVALANLGAISLRRHDLVRAAGYLRRALAARDLAPDPYEAEAIHRDLAEVAVRSGQPAQAEAHLARAGELRERAAHSAGDQPLSYRPA